MNPLLNSMRNLASSTGSAAEKLTELIHAAIGPAVMTVGDLLAPKYGAKNSIEEKIWQGLDSLSQQHVLMLQCPSEGDIQVTYITTAPDYHIFFLRTLETWSMDHFKQFAHRGKLTLKIGTPRNSDCGEHYKPDALEKQIKKWGLNVDFENCLPKVNCIATSDTDKAIAGYKNCVALTKILNKYPELQQAHFDQIQNMLELFNDTSYPYEAITQQNASTGGTGQKEYALQLFSDLLNSTEKKDYDNNANFLRLKLLHTEAIEAIHRHKTKKLDQRLVDLYERVNSRNTTKLPGTTSCSSSSRSNKPQHFVKLGAVYRVDNGVWVQRLSENAFILYDSSKLHQRSVQFLGTKIYNIKKVKKSSEPFKAVGEPSHHFLLNIYAMLYEGNPTVLPAKRELPNKLVMYGFMKNLAHSTVENAQIKLVEGTNELAKFDGASATSLQSSHIEKLVQAIIKCRDQENALAMNMVQPAPKAIPATTPHQTALLPAPNAAANGHRNQRTYHRKSSAYTSRFYKNPTRPPKDKTNLAETRASKLANKASAIEAPKVDLATLKPIIPAHQHTNPTAFQKLQRTAQAYQLLLEHRDHLKGHEISKKVSLVDLALITMHQMLLEKLKSQYGQTLHSKFEAIRNSFSHHFLYLTTQCGDLLNKGSMTSFVNSITKLNGEPAQNSQTPKLSHPYLSKQLPIPDTATKYRWVHEYHSYDEIKLELCTLSTLLMNTAENQDLGKFLLYGLAMSFSNMVTGKAFALHKTNQVTADDEMESPSQEYSFDQNGIEALRNSGLSDEQITACERIVQARNELAHNDVILTGDYYSTPAGEVELHNDLKSVFNAINSISKQGRVVPRPGLHYQSRSCEVLMAPNLT